MEQVVAKLLHVTIDTYHMNVALNTISLGHCKKFVTKVNKRYT